ncbi:MAG: NAD(P)H-dependent glycerol-3-phosphate dehydrogenase [Acetobacteraceae bacterium]|nr:NAD(P)H-dependent glycerol-3-phosphate dehydrogenase [Acetobacteraceae bacterium]
MSSIAVVGAGAWGCALARQAHRAGATVALWARDPARVRDPSLTASAILPEGGHDLILLSVPVQHLRAVLGRFRPRAPVVVCGKGIEAQTGRLPLEIVDAVHPGVPGAVLSGPNFAGEIAAGLPAAAIVAATDAALRASVIQALASAQFRLYGNDDPVGAQFGGAAKNVMAIAAGVVIGAGLGDNARAALITRGVAELTRGAAALGGRAETVAGLSGLGDLLLTCTGPASRNYQCGLALGRGSTLAEALAAAPGVVEGVATAPALLARAEGVDLPICRAVADLLAGQSTVAGAVAALLARPLRDE